MKLPVRRNPIQSSELNITYHELVSMNDKETKEWIDDLKSELLQIWDETHTPPSIGKSEKDIIKSFDKLSDYDVNQLFYEDSNYPDFIGFIKNFTKIGSPVNQFFPNMLKTKIGGKSMYDWFSNKDLSQEFRRTMVRACKWDGMYGYTKVMNKGDEKSLKDNQDYWVEPSSDKIRVYDKTEKVFPKIIQIFRLGLGQPPVNFSPLTSRWIYEKYLDGIRVKSKYKIYDPCAGFGGRLLGSLCSSLPIHYIGTDPNTNNFGCYEKLGSWYNNHCFGNNTFDIYQDGCEVIDQNEDFKKYMGKIDLVFTSPPYFDTENYSDDETQSIHRFNNYEDWKIGFLKRMIEISYESLSVDRYMIINISDVKGGDDDFIPLEQDTISLAMKSGFQYVGKIGMVMSRMIGLHPNKLKNSWFDETTMTDYKIEPILVFFKNVKWIWDKDD